MVGAVVAVGFVVMVLAPCGIAIYSKLGSSSESSAILNTADADVSAAAVLDVPAPPSELSNFPQPFVRRPNPLSTSRGTLPTPAPIAVPSLREVAERAAREAIQAQAAAAKAQVEALQEASRAAAKRAAAAEKLAEAAESELVRASHAVVQAEAAKAQAKLAQAQASDRDYLPHDHPSLDFPRSRVFPRKVGLIWIPPPPGFDPNIFIPWDLHPKYLS